MKKIEKAMPKDIGVVVDPAALGLKMQGQEMKWDNVIKIRILQQIHKQ